MNIFLSTGELSGDIVAARLAGALRARRPDIRLRGLGGSRMAAAGVDVVARVDALGSIGITEIAHAVPEAGRALRSVRRVMRHDPPAAAVLIGTDGFNVLLARWLRAHHVPVISYFPPQVWVWRALAGPIARSFDVMLTCFAAEHEVYKRAAPSVDVQFVGHYLCDALRPVTSEQRRAARVRLGVEAGARLIGLLPGSRLQEVRALLPALMDAAARLSARDSTTRFVVPIADASHVAAIRDEVDRHRLAGCVTILGQVGPEPQASHEAMRAADLVVLASGTASLEATLLGVPMVIVYRLSRVTAGVVYTCIRMGLIDTDTIGLPNLILGRRAVPELKQGEVTGARIAAEVEAVLGSAARLGELRTSLGEAAALVSGHGSIDRVADIVLARAVHHPAVRGAVASRAPEPVSRAGFD